MNAGSNGNRSVMLVGHSTNTFSNTSRDTCDTPNCSSVDSTFNLSNFSFDLSFDF